MTADQRRGCQKRDWRLTCAPRDAAPTAVIRRMRLLQGSKPDSRGIAQRVAGSGFACAGESGDFAFERRDSRTSMRYRK
jgi:hypothetical protein